MYSIAPKSGAPGTPRQRACGSQDASNGAISLRMYSFNNPCEVAVSWSLRCGIPLAFLLSLVSPHACAVNWRQPTTEELKMTSDPAAPDAPAVYLYREEIVDNGLEFHRLYARIKILNERGKEQFSNVLIPYEPEVTGVRAIEGRTIHPDGSIVPFTGKPYDREVIKAGDIKVMEKVFSMPDVTVGSILEYTYDLQYHDYTFIVPDWDLQQAAFVHHAHYRFNPVSRVFSLSTVRDQPYYLAAPAGTRITHSMDGVYDLVVDNLPAVPEEEYSPPLASFSYRLVFFSVPAVGADYWKTKGNEWSKDVDRFVNPNENIRRTVAGMISPSDTDEQKLRKIYAAVMTVENTRFTREHTSLENKAQGLRIKTAADIWAQKRGSDDEITRLFISMARAAGLKAYGMAVTERDRSILNTADLDWGQLEDEIAIVNLGGKDVYFDPGQRDCEYGKLHWMHTEVFGIRQAENGTAILMTPSASYADNETVRDAKLDIGPDGSLKGILRISMKGAEALRWRQAFLRTDEQQTKDDFEKDLRSRIPEGAIIKMDHFVGLTDNGSSLLAIVEVSGTMGTAAGKRFILPSSFFEAGVKPIFAEAQRENPIDLRYPYAVEDRATLKLGPGLSIEAVPSDADVPMGKRAAYTARYKHEDDTYSEDRVIVVGASRFRKDEYRELRDFFQNASAQDQQQLVLKRSTVGATSPAQ